MKPFEFIHYKGKSIAIVDISNTTPEEAIAYFQVAQPQIARLPLHSALILTDSTGARFTQESANAIKEFAVKNSPQVKASATVGAEGLREVLRISVERAADRTIKAFPTREEALDWLVDQ